jgi:predicted deacylase
MTRAYENLEILPVDISAYAKGNTGIPFTTTLESGCEGPHLMISALVHGNELCGAHALAQLFERDIRPERGKLSLVFANTAAYDSFDPDHPGWSRYIDDDFNRVWSASVSDGGDASVELSRAREIRPLLDQADHLLDLHSMQTDCAPLGLSGHTAKCLKLAQALLIEMDIVIDAGHAQGTRMRDYGDFSNPESDRSALLLECGQHWKASSGEVAISACYRFLGHFGLVAPDLADEMAPPSARPSRIIEVTHAVTAGNGAFRFAEEYQGLDLIARADTTIADNGGKPVVTPYDDCILIMPSRRLQPGQTAVRFGRDVA